MKHKPRYQFDVIYRCIKSICRIAKLHFLIFMKHTPRYQFDVIYRRIKSVCRIAKPRFLIFKCQAGRQVARTEGASHISIFVFLSVIRMLLASLEIRAPTSDISGVDSKFEFANTFNILVGIIKFRFLVYKRRSESQSYSSFCNFSK